MKQIGYSYLISCAALLALVSVFTRHIQDMDMQTIVFVRALLAAIFIGGIIIMRRDWKALKPVDMPNTLIVGSAQSSMMLLFTGALMNTTVANTILLSYMATSCFSLLFIICFFKQGVPNRAFGNLVFSFIGLFLVAGPQDVSLSSQQIMGNLMALGSGLSYAVMMIWSKSLSQKANGAYVVFWQYVVATIVLLPFATIGTSVLLLENALPLIGLGFLCTGLAFFLLMFGMRLVPPSHGLIVPLFESVFTIGVAALLLQEPLSSGTIVGAGLIVFGAYRITAVTSGYEQGVVKNARSESLVLQIKLAITNLGGHLSRQIQKRHAILLPLRLFIGLGWLRASIEKLLEPDWYSGAALHHFFYERIAEGDVAFPFYQFLMEGLFFTHAPLLSKLIIVGELYCGFAILLGLLMRPALLAGLFMNLNFILAGSVNPSAFYIVIQLTLLVSVVGEVFGIDSILLPLNSFARGTPRRRYLIERAKMVLCFGGTLLCMIITIPTAYAIKTIDPVQSVEDPAALLLILLGLQSLLLLILGGRAAERLRNMGHKTDMASLNEVVQSVRQYPIPEFIPSCRHSSWSITKLEQPMLYKNVSA